MSIVRTWMTKNKSDRLHNKGCHLKGQYNVTFSCTKGLSMQTNKCMATSASLCEGPIFYFYSWVIILLQKAPVREHHCHLYALLLIDIEYECDWISFVMIIMSSQSLIFRGALHLCFAVSERASEIPFVSGKRHLWDHWDPFYGWRARDCAKSGSGGQHKDHLPRFGPRGCVKP